MSAEDSERMLAAIEKAQRGFAHELHDGPIQSFTAALMFLEAIATDALDDKTAPRIEEAKLLLRKGVEETRRIMHGLHPE